MEINRATEQDLQVIKENVALLYEYSRYNPSRERMESLIETTLGTGAYHLVLKEEGEIKGWVMLTAGRKDNFTEELYGFIYELVVFPEERGKGYGKALLVAAAEELREQGMTEVRLNVFEGNPAQHLYEKAGYETDSRLMRMPLER